ncbi:site-specific DNA-methyltransferase [Coraliomargarita parva]|uniref:site-specific DNA-methyltransferase n=1 Tax=Coraliomargarita parva TaxID=3014050 RepID=UPI0022B2C1E5|nr:site-specific DNA-methyltransferase [Coraliomargarita parva]
MPKKKTATKKQVDALVHEDAKRKNIPTAEYESVMEQDAQSPIQLAYERRNRDLDPQLVWRGKDEQDWSDLVVQAPPLYIQEKVHPKVLIDDLLRRTEKADANEEPQMDLFGDFNGLPSEEAKTEFYQHDAHWTNRMILGDSLGVMASLAEREGLRGKVQCIYLDPPYGIKFNSNFQWSTTDQKGTKQDSTSKITREPEMVKAFRDTWREGIHTYLTYLRDRLTVARDLLSDSGSLFIQIGEENVHRVRALAEEVFGEDSLIAQIWFRKKTMPLGATYLERMGDYVLWFGKNAKQTKFRRLYRSIDIVGDFHWNWRQLDEIDRRKYSKRELESNPSGDPFRLVSMWPPSFSEKDVYDFPFRGKTWAPPRGQCYASSREKMDRVAKADRLQIEGQYVRYVMKLSDDNTTKLNSTWTDTTGARDKRYVVETSEFVVQRCLLMATDPGDLVLDPTCGSGTTAYVAEHWGRRWITIDTSRVALALARARIMGAKYPYYLLADSKEGQQKEAELTRTAPSEAPTYGNIRQGFVYERVPHITLKSIANNAEIDVIWDDFQTRLEPLREQLNKVLGTSWEEWEIPREAEDKWNGQAKQIHADWWKERIARQKEIDASIAAKADSEYLYDKPYEDKKKVRVAGPFTVESLSPHRTLGVDEDDELIDPLKASEGKQGDFASQKSFAEIILENLKTAGVQQAHKEDKIKFTTLTPWPGELVCAEGIYTEGESGSEKRAGIFIGPEFGTVARVDLVQAAREAGDANFDVLIACAFNYEARTTEFDKLGRLPVLKARMNADLHMADELKNTGSGNLFVIFGEPDIDILPDDHGKLRVKVNGVDVFKPQSGKVESSNTDEIACWFIDTDYNEESFFVRHAYFLGSADPYKNLKTTLKAEINTETWDTLYSDISRPFNKPTSGRIAVKVINHLGDEVMKVFRV